jgi:glycosyltransferase XagB
MRRLMLDGPADWASLDLERSDRYLSDDGMSPLERPTAKDGLGLGQSLILLSLFALLILSVILWPKTSLQGLQIGLWSLFLISSLVRGVAVLISSPRACASLPQLPNTKLPVYSVIVPLYREANMVRQLVRNLKALTYPRWALDIIFVIETDDALTLRALKGKSLPPWMRIIIAPPGAPQTKPRACNIALKQAKGSLVVIYDAEDQPDPRQLLEAAQRFAEGDDRLACLQAPLRISSGLGFWSRQFALEYAAHFETFLPALSRAGLALPLGGTSNHLRASTLRQLGGWDPYNVTEDADLGFRLASAGYRTEMLSLPTWETPTASYRVWLPQRSRWLKGYLQTLIVWTRQNHRLGLKDQASLWLTLGVSVLSAGLHGPIALLLLVQTVLALLGWGAFISPAGLALVATAWAAAMISMSVGAKRAGIELKVRDLFLAGAYWPFATLAAIRAINQLLRQPYYWDKTPHKPEPLRTPL